ncbi:hypothetical protein PQG02_04825 [Nostoc sp. UHCC 0926]|uniref:hypothetical protein n=1 Tax=unclassified Nostoc TaxID=2593658 RepID=UPI0023629DAC|nr:hypothetical protein [Nostoc sp. UHCC 0926]WDD33706.1 hypothetical protein PQG02_04825 [Nostoc sp. UHCC 0926]
MSQSCVTHSESYHVRQITHKKTTPPPTPPRRRGGELKRSFGGVGFRVLCLIARTSYHRASQPAFDITDDKWLRVCALFVYIWFAIALTGYHKRKVVTFVNHWRHWI